MTRKFIYLILIPLINIVLIVWGYHYIHQLCAENLCASGAVSLLLEVYIPSILCIIFSILYGLIKKMSPWWNVLIFILLVFSIYLTYRQSQPIIYY